MIISINTETPLSDLDREVLRLLVGLHAEEPATTPPRQEEPEDSTRTAAKKAPAKRAAKKATAKPEPEPDEPDDEPDDESESLLDQAIAKATEKVNAGKRAKVQSALKKVGAKKVSDLSNDDDIRTFLKALG